MRLTPILGLSDQKLKKRERLGGKGNKMGEGKEESSRGS